MRIKNILIYSLLLIMATSLNAQESCEDAILIDGQSTGCFSIDFSTASNNTMNGSCVSDESDANRWFYFTADGPELIIESTHNNGETVFITVLRYTGLDCDPIKYEELICFENNYSNADILTDGEKYHVIINVENNQGGEVEFCLTNPDITPPPVNDLPCAAITLIPDSTCVIGTTVNAEPDVDTFQCAPEYTNEVWYKFTTGSDLVFGAQVFIDSISITGDVRIMLTEFINEDCSTMFFIKQQYCGPANGFAFDYVNLDPDKTYFLSVATAPEAQGEFSLCIEQMQALIHTDPCNAMVVTPNDSCLSFDTYYSVFEYDLPDCDYTNQKLWFQFYTENDLSGISLALEKLGDDENVFLGLGYYQGNWCENVFHWVDTYCGDVSGANFSADNLMKNQIYHIAVGTNYGFTGEFDLCINGDYDSPYTNGSPCTAYNIDDFSGCVGGSSQYGSLITEDSICFDFSPLRQTWYKVDLQEYNQAIDVFFNGHSDIPVHEIQLGYFENGCKDSFVVLDDYCGISDSSDVSFTFADSIDYAYISISLPTDETYNYSVCVNPLELSMYCVDNDFCQESEFVGSVELDDNICGLYCTYGATRENSDEYYTSKYPTTWYSFNTGEGVGELFIEFSNSTVPSFFVGLSESGNCSADAFEISRYVQMTDYGNLRIPVNENTSYNIAITAINTVGGQVDICMNGEADNLCKSADFLTVESTSLGSPKEGPFQEGEVVNLCYTIESFNTVEEASCQWLQGIVPNFGESWADESFDTTGLPVVTNSLIPVSPNVEWGWRNDVHSSLTNQYRRISENINGNPEVCHVDQNNCSGNMLADGDLLPSGWYAWNYSQGIYHPDSTYGDGVSCTGTNGSWQVCFDLIVGEITNDSDLSVSIHTFSDGEIGMDDIVDSSCMEDMPVYSKYYIDCGTTPIDSVLSVKTCSGNLSTINLPDEYYYFWFSIDNPRVTGETSGSGNYIDIELETVATTISQVTYFVQAYSPSGCHLVNYEITIDVYPELDIQREPLFTLCQNDSVPMNEVINLESQIIGDFYVDWDSPIIDDFKDAYFSGNESVSVPYQVLSAAGCYFQDTVNIHVEDVIVEDFVVPYTICRDDVLNLSAALPLEAIIEDPFTVDWEYGNIDDVPDSDTSFQASDKIPFTITGQTGCTYSDTLEIEVPFVAINVLGQDEYCSSDTVSISAGYIFDEPHEKFWIYPNGDTLFSAGLASPANVFVDGDNYLEFHLFTKEGCPFYDYDTITMYPVPEFTFNQDTQFLGICPYDSLQLSVDLSPYYYGVNWTTPEGIFDENELIINEEGWYIVDAGYTSSTINCINKDSFHLEIYPSVETEFFYDPIICQGDSTLLESAEPNYIYNWSNGNFSSAELVPGGNYKITVSNGEGCKQFFDINITEQAPPVVEFEYDSIICEGDSTWIIAGQESLQYNWSNGVDSSAILSFGGDYGVLVTDDEMCQDSFEISVEMLTYPEVQFTYELIQDTLYLFDESGNAEFCQWMINDDLLGVAGDTTLVLQEGDYAVSLSCNNGPCGTFVLEDISVIILGLEAQKSRILNIYPNPSNGKFLIDFKSADFIESVEMYNLQGSKVYSKEVNQIVEKLDLSTNLPSGTYIVKINSTDSEFVKMVVIAR